MRTFFVSVLTPDNLPLPPEGRLLDAGCGMGLWLTPLLARGYDAYGLDPSADDITHLQARWPERAHTPAGPRFRAESLENTTFPAEFFSAVLCLDVLHCAQTPTQARAMRQALLRLLRPGGWLIFRYHAVSITATLLTDWPLGTWFWPATPDAQQRVTGGWQKPALNL